MLRRTRAAVSGAYAAQGLGYAVVVTSLPALKARQGVDDTAVTLIVLGVCVFAAGGSLVANAISVRAGSRIALSAGLGLQAVALIAIALPAPPFAFLTAFALYGVGLGCVDAATAMQGVLVQRAHGSPLLGRFFGYYTLGAIVGAVGVSTVAAVFGEAPELRVGVMLGATAVVSLTVATRGLRRFSPDLPAPDHTRAARTPLPRRGVWAFGVVILVAFVVDSAVSTWSTVYLADGLGAASWLAPVAYAGYQAMVLLARFGADPTVRALGARAVVIAAILVAVAGCAVIAAVPSIAWAIVGFIACGAAAGLLVPLAFSAAGDLVPERSDEVIARVNTFTYAGSVGGAVAVGALAEGPGLAIGFAIPAVSLLALLALLRAFPVGVVGAQTARN
jgi:MFS family permease